MRWQLIIEEYLPELIYLKGEHNIVADALSRLELISPKKQQEIRENNHDMHYLVDHFGLEDDDLPVNAYPLQYKIIAKYQRKQVDLVQSSISRRVLNQILLRRWKAARLNLPQ
jgi:hypothetical protein